LRLQRRIDCMALKLISWSVRPLAAILAASLLCALGCHKPQQIQTYTVPKEPKVAAIADATDAKPGEPTDRMLAAIVPSGEQAWFFKAVGPIADIDKHEKEINDFFTSLTLTPDGRAHWKLPANWKEEPGNGIRLATIVIPDDKRLEITISTANWSDAQKSMLDNVNRWRGQLQLAPIGPKQLPDVSRAAKAGDRPITIVDMRGQFKSGGMTPPFAGGSSTTSGRKPTSADTSLPVGHPPIDAAPNLPAGHPPIDPSPPTAANSTTANAPAATDVPGFTAPTSWKQVPTRGLRKAEFAVTDGSQAASVTLITFPANEGSLIADPVANINRWRGELGLSQIKKEALATATETITVDGQPATYAAMIPDAAKPEESQAKEATLAAIVKTGRQIWFIKMKGDRDVIKKHQDEFKAFLKSLRFSNDKEAGNGNK
jgi:hypothetical protein